MTMYEKYCQLDIDGRWIGLEKSDVCADYFCTPLDATVIGWENSILEPKEEPYEYVKAVQEKFDDSKIRYSNEYYDTLGLERPDGSENDVQLMEFETVTFSLVKNS